MWFVSLQKIREFRIINWTELLKFVGSYFASKSDTIHTYIHMNGPKLAYTSEWFRDMQHLK